SQIPPPPVAGCLRADVDHGELPSFPTRRSSDLAVVRPARPAPVGQRNRNGRSPAAQGLRATDHARPDRLPDAHHGGDGRSPPAGDRKSTRLNSSHVKISYAVFCLKKKNIRRHVL